MSDRVGTPEDRISRVAAQILVVNVVNDPRRSLCSSPLCVYVAFHMFMWAEMELQTPFDWRRNETKEKRRLPYRANQLNVDRKLCVM